MRCLGRGVGFVCGGDLFWCWVVWVLVVGLCVDVLLVGNLFTGLVGGFLILFCCVFVGFWFACLACLRGWQVATTVVWILVFWCSLAILANLVVSLLVVA